MKIRRYKSTDYISVLALHILALQHANAYLGPGPWDDDLNHIEEVYLCQGEFLVGHQHDRLIAMAGIRPFTENIAELKRMRVHPEVQRQGYGRQVLKALEARAMKLGYNIIHLDTLISQSAAIHLYHSQGYMQTDEFIMPSSGLVTLVFEKYLR